jgi:hypothetical protein
MANRASQIPEAGEADPVKIGFRDEKTDFSSVGKKRPARPV